MSARWWMLGLLAACGHPTGDGPDDTDDTDDTDATPTALVHRVGRFDDADPAAPASTWSATTLRTRVEGTSLSIRLDGAAGVWFEVRVDDEVTGRFTTTAGEGLYPVAQGLPAGTHDVEVVRRNEGFFGVVKTLGFETGPGATLVETAWPYAHRIEFIGDAGNAGYGVEGADAYCTFSAETENASLTFAAIAARAVGAAAHHIAFSGKGVVQNYGGDRVEPMPALYARTLTGSPTPVWDFASFPADAVVVNLGRNDFSAPIDDQDFIDGYAAFLDTIRGHHPDAAIFAVSWSDWTPVQAALIPEAITTTGDGNTYALTFDTLPEEGFGCDFQPSRITHQRLGDEIAAALRTTLGW